MAEYGPEKKGGLNSLEWTIRGKESGAQKEKAARPRTTFTDHREGKKKNDPRRKNRSRYSKLLKGP